MMPTRRGLFGCVIPSFNWLGGPRLGLGARVIKGLTLIATGFTRELIPFVFKRLSRFGLDDGVNPAIYWLHTVYDIG